MEFDDEANGIYFTLPTDFVGELSTIYVYISDKHDERQYFFYLRGDTGREDESEVDNMPKLEVQEKYEKLLTEEDLEQEAQRNFEYDEEEYCLPSYT